MAAGVIIRAWQKSDFAGIQQLSTAEGWHTPRLRAEASRQAWQNSFPALVAEKDGELIGFLRAISDSSVTTFVCELLVAPQYRGRGIGAALLDKCQALCPGCRLELLATQSSQAYYKQVGFHQFYGFRRSWEERHFQRS